jgi:hypothetical protein
MMKVSNLKFAVVALALSAFCSISTEASVSLKKNVLVHTQEVKGDSLILGSSDAELMEKMSAIKLGVISEPLGTLTLSKEALKKKLSGVSEKIEIPETITIKRTGAIIKAAEIIDAICTECKKWEEAGETFRVDVSKVPSSIVLPGNLISYSLETKAQNKLGMKLYTITGETDGGPFRNLIQVSVSKVVEGAKLTRLAKAGELITEDMVIREIQEIRSDKSNVPVTYCEAIGKTLDRFKSAGTLIRGTDLSSKPRLDLPCETNVAQGPSKATKTVSKAIEKQELVIKAGDVVEYCVRAGGLSLRIPAKAVQGGTYGDEIGLINLQNKKPIRGTIAEEGLVEYATR